VATRTLFSGFVCPTRKRKRREDVNISSDYVGFYIEDNFVVGYGMDYNGNLEIYQTFIFLKFKLIELKGVFCGDCFGY
jgi:hypothetical protein